MLSNFGGVGARATRGFGAFSIIGGLDDDFPIVKDAKNLEDGLRYVARICFGVSPESSKSGVAEFSIVHPSFWICVIPQGNHFWDKDIRNLMNKVGTSFRDSREDRNSPFSHKEIKGYHTRDYAVISQWVREGGNGPLSKSLPQTAYGLPHQYRSSGGLSVMIDGGDRKRRVSPLRIHFHNFGGNFAVSYQLFKAQFLDREVTIFDIKTRKSALVANPIAYDELDEFLDRLGEKRRLHL
jgi:CRISPR/Cas system CMR-associated protein Cmr1 (group 7 of RAMP superfamily)